MDGLKGKLLKAAAGEGKEWDVMGRIIPGDGVGQAFICVLGTRP
jgi:hypothetical protein